MTKLPKTYGEAMAMGYKDADVTWQQGYVSRKSDINGLPVEVAGGSRKGQLYVLMPSWESSYYCYRQYLRKGKA